MAYKKNYGSGGNSKKFGNNSNRYNCGTISNSGSKSYGYTSNTRKPKETFGGSVSRAIMGNSAYKDYTSGGFSHGGDKKKRNKGKGSR